MDCRMRLGMSIATGGQGTAQFNPQTLRVEKSSGTSVGMQFHQRGKLFSINNTPLLKSSILIRSPELRLNGEVFLNITSIFQVGNKNRMRILVSVVVCHRRIPTVGYHWRRSHVSVAKKNIYPCRCSVRAFFCKRQYRFSIEITTGIRFELP